MDNDSGYLIAYNKHLTENLDYCIHLIDSRLDKLYSYNEEHYNQAKYSINATASPYSNYTYLHFKAPYIRDIRNFSGPANEDVRQIKELTGTQNVNNLIKNKIWSKESKQNLVDAIHDHFSQVHIIELIKQKNLLANQPDKSSDNNSDLEQKLNLIDGQIEQVRARKDQRIFVPQDRNDTNIDWCAISAKLKNTAHEARDCRLMWSNNLHWSINNGLWTKEEDTCLLAAVQKYGQNDWDSVANELNSNRLPWQCCSRYQQEFANGTSASTPMSEDDIDKIIEVINLCRIGNYVPWNQVMYFIQYRSLLQVKYQWNKLISMRGSKMPWSHDEDVLLLNAVEKYGPKEWNRIANCIPGRTNKSCRERYIMRLKFPKRIIGNWTRKEDERLLSQVNRFGTNWSLISAHFPERNDHQLRNRYELLKNDLTRIGPVRHRKLHRSSDGSLVTIQGRRPKPLSERQVDQRLSEIFSTYRTVKQSSKSLVCRSAQDELIYQNLVEILHNILDGNECKRSLLGTIIHKALKRRVTSEFDLFTPCLSTIRGYKAWTLQQDYLSQFTDATFDLDEITMTTEYSRVLKIAVSLFLWPAILSRIQPYKLDPKYLQSKTIIEKDAKIFYKIRSIQKQLTIQYD